MTKGEIVGQKLKLSLMSIIDDNGRSQGRPKMGPTSPKMKDYGLPQTTWNTKDTETRILVQSDGLVVEEKWIAWKAINKKTK